MDLHDPSGVHLYRAWNACLAGLIAAMGLYLVPAIAQPLLVIAAIIFTHTTSDRDRPSRPTVLLGALMAVLLSTSVLTLTQFQPVLQTIVLVGLGFLAQFGTQFGDAFTVGSLVWILSVIASAETSTVGQLPITGLNLTLGFLIAYICHFWVAPYRPHRVLRSVFQRTRLRLVERLNRAVHGLDSRSDTQRSSNRPPDGDLDRRIVSLIKTQNVLLNKMTRQRPAPNRVIANYQQAVAAEGEWFEAILVLEQSLLMLKYTDDVPLPLQLGLQQLSRQITEIFGQNLPLQRPCPLFHLESDFEQWLQAFVSNSLKAETASRRQVLLADQVPRQNVNQAIQALLSKINAIAELTIALQEATDA